VVESVGEETDASGSLILVRKRFGARHVSFGHCKQRPVSLERLVTVDAIWYKYKQFCKLNIQKSTGRSLPSVSKKEESSCSVANYSLERERRDLICQGDQVRVGGVTVCSGQRSGWRKQDHIGRVKIDRETKWQGTVDGIVRDPEILPPSGDVVSVRIASGEYRIDG
jgi:hypothetical protein